jgi:hypothetical protein
VGDCDRERGDASQQIERGDAVHVDRSFGIGRNDQVITRLQAARR